MEICAFKLNHDDGDIANNDVCAKQAMDLFFQTQGNTESGHFWYGSSHFGVLNDDPLDLLWDSTDFFLRFAKEELDDFACTRCIPEDLTRY